MDNSSILEVFQIRNGASIKKIGLTLFLCSLFVVIPLSSPASANANSYNLSAAQAEDIYYHLHGETPAAKVQEAIMEFMPFGSGVIANDGFSLEDRQAFEQAYHNNTGVRVTIDYGVTSYDTEVTYEPLL